MWYLIGNVFFSFLGISFLDMMLILRNTEASENEVESVKLYLGTCSI